MKILEVKCGIQHQFKGDILSVLLSLPFLKVRLRIFIEVNIFGLCFDLNDRSTYDLIKKWTITIKSGNPIASCFLIGCKSDLEQKINPK
jgi:hypothetical protein